MFSRNPCISFPAIFFMLLMLTFSNDLSAQSALKITGQVLTEDKQPIRDANLSLKSNTGALISFKSTDKNGNFLFEIKGNGKEFIVETSYLGFQRDSQLVSFKGVEEKINLEILLKTTITNLREIHIAPEPAAISIKNDTTTYKVKNFLTGNEEVVEDVMKKLPGVEVSENGRITYKGKSISKVLIEGDDLFSKNYQIGTKNIKSVVLDEVQAIENYVENEKLIGFTKTNETVLNLKIKEEAKNKPNLSASLAYGYNKNYLVDNNLIGISKAFKYFLFNNMNNVGANPTPYHYFDFNNSSEESTEASLHQTKLIGVTYSLPVLNPKRGNVNQNYFSTGNAFLRLNKNLNLTTNYNVYADKISLFKASLTEFGKLVGGVSFSEYRLITKKPIIGSTSFNLLYDLSKNSNIRYISNFNIAKIKSSEELTANYGNFVSDLRDNTTSLEQQLEYTNRLSANRALKIKTTYLFSNQPQNYLLSPSLTIMNASLNKQTINLIGNFYNINSEYVFKTRSVIHTLAFQYDKKWEHMKSHASGINAYRNNMIKDDDDVNIGYTNTLALKRIQLSTALFYNGKNSVVKGDEISTLRNTINFLSPSINLQYKLNAYDKLMVASSYDRFLPELADLYQNYIVIDNKSLSKGVYQNSVIGKYSLVTTFIHSDLFNQFIYFLNFIYLKTSKSYGSSQEITPYYILNNRAIFPGVQNYILNGSFSKYLPFIRSTIKYHHNLNWFQFYAQINNSAIQNYPAFNSNQRFEIKSGFDGPFDFETGLKVITTKFSVVAHNNYSMQLFSNVFLKPSERLSFSISNEVYVNKLTQNSYQKFYFLDINAKYNFNKKTTLRVVGENITNNKFFNTKSVNQFSISNDSYRLLPATLLFEVNYRF